MSPRLMCTGENSHHIGRRVFFAALPSHSSTEESVDAAVYRYSRVKIAMARATKDLKERRKNRSY